MTPSPDPPPHAAPHHLRWHGGTDRGRVRPNNEDAFLGLQFDAREVHHLGRIGEASAVGNDFVFAVSDGMGGAMAGEFASRITVEKVTRLLPAFFRRSEIGIEKGHGGWLFRNGKLNEREARTHPRRNVLQKALGAGHQFIDPQVGVVPCAPGDRFLLCTDGLVDGLFDDQLVEFMTAPDPARALIAASLERAGRDNTTALVVEVTGES